LQSYMLGLAARMVGCCSLDHEEPSAGVGDPVPECSAEVAPSQAVDAEVAPSQAVELLFANRTLELFPRSDGLTRGWRCRDWTLKWLDETLGQHEVEISHKDKCGNKVSRERVLLRHFLKHHDDLSWCPAGTVPYVDNFDVMSLAPELKAECPSEALFGSHRSLVIHGGFLGPSGSCTRLHVDSEDNIIYCAFGRKLFILLPPSAIDDVDYDARGIPLEDPWHPAVEEKVKHHPMFRRCVDAVRVVVLGPGDLLVQPRGWLHMVYNLELSLSIACWAKACPPPGEASLGSDASWVGHQAERV